MTIPLCAFKPANAPSRRRLFLRLCSLALAITVLAGCSVKRVAINKLGDALANSGTTFASDNDPEFVGNAIPFSLKLIESLLAESPSHKGLLLAACSGFTQYDYVYIQQSADQAEVTDIQQHLALKARAKKMFLRARDYGLRGLEVSHKGFREALHADARAAVRVVSKKDVPLLYWTASAWAMAISDSKDDPELIADQTTVESLIDRAYELDPTFDHGAIESFLISYEAARQGAKGDSAERSRQHFERAVALSDGQLAGPFVAMAETVSLAKQDRAEFESLLNRALKIDPDTHPETRLANLIMQRRARWLLGRTDDLFLGNPPADGGGTGTSYFISIEQSFQELFQ
jgi:predicted anti-sigma-YlaC factor YlaD